VAISPPPILVPDAPTSRRSPLDPIFERDSSRQPDTSPGTTEEPIVAVGGGEVLNEALPVEHYPGGDLLRTNPRQGQVPR
jgi:hypothetical protein